MTNSIETCGICGDKLQRTVTADQNDILTYHCRICGNLKLTIEFLKKSRELISSNNHIISGICRERSEFNQEPVLINSSSIHDLLVQSFIPKTVSQKLEKILLYIERHSEYLSRWIPLITETNYPIAFAKNDSEFQSLIRHLDNQKLIFVHPDRRSVQLSPEGWIRLESLKKPSPNSKQAFIAMWFSEKTDDAYKNGISKAIIDTGFSPIRVDLIHHNEKIDDRIIAEIRKSAFLVADFTGSRGGVYFEAGFALGLGIPVIWSCRKNDVKKVHFDTRQYNHIVWNDSSDLYRQLRDRIEATIKVR